MRERGEQHGGIEHAIGVPRAACKTYLCERRDHIGNKYRFREQAHIVEDALEQRMPDRGDGGRGWGDTNISKINFFQILVEVEEYG